MKTHISLAISVYQMIKFYHRLVSKHVVQSFPDVSTTLNGTQINKMKLTKRTGLYEDNNNFQEM